jgi:cbb3-type cytochrome oxidase subunit 3
MVSFKKIALFLFFIGFKVIAFSQCAMCKAVVESDMQGGGTAGENINNGILYLMFIPYLLMGSVGYFIYRHYKKNKLAKSN